jgi:hypothetical protein
MIILKWLFKKWDGGMDWIDVTQNGGKWLVVVNAVMNFLVPVNVGNFLST